MNNHKCTDFDEFNIYLIVLDSQGMFLEVLDNEGNRTCCEIIYCPICGKHHREILESE